MKRYIFRVVRYTLYLLVIFVIVLSVMHLTGYSKLSPETFSMFFVSEKSATLGFVMLALILLHPLISFGKRSLGIDFNTKREYIENILTEYGYELKSEDEECVKYDKAKLSARILSPYDTTIIIYKNSFPSMIGEVENL